MPLKSKDVVKEYFDESTEESQSEQTFLSPSEQEQSETDFNATSSRQPLASSSRASLRNAIENSAQKSRPASAQKPGPKSAQKPRPKSKQNIRNPSPERQYQSTIRTRLQSLTPGKSQNVQNISRRNTKYNPEPSTSRRKQNIPKKKTVLNEIRKFQHSTDLLIPKLPFSRVIREVLMDPYITDNNMRITPKAIESLQEAAEIYLTIFFEDSYRCTIHRGRITLIVKDMELVRILRGVNDPGYKT